MKKEFTTEELRYMAQEVNSWDGSLEHLEFYNIEMIDELFDGLEPLEILNRAHFGEFNPNDDYFKFSGYGNLISLSSFDLEDELTNNVVEIVERYKELATEGAVDGELLDEFDEA